MLLGVGFIIIAGVVIYGLYVALVLARRHAAERVLHLLADAVRLELPLLPLIASASEDARFWERAILRRLGTGLETGLPLDQAILKASALFPPLVVSQIEAGLRCGQLPQALNDAVHAYDGQAHRRSEMFGPFLYLGLLSIAAISVSSLEMYFLVPKVERICNNYGLPLPWPYEVLLKLTAVLGPLSAILIIVGILAMFILLTGRQASGRGFIGDVLDLARWLVPGWRDCARTAGLAAAARQMSLALSAGATEAEALAQAAGLKVNLFVRQRLDRGLDLHLAGQKSLAESFRLAGGFPEHFIWTVATGEVAGNLPLALGRLADDYELRYSRLQMILWNAAQVVGVILIGCFVALQGLCVFTLMTQLISGANPK
jgi:type II secretory pathway component PulF